MKKKTSALRSKNVFVGVIIAFFIALIYIATLLKLQS